MKVYPSWRYHLNEPRRLVRSAEEDAKLGSDWAETPAHFGIETCPGRTPDPAIAERRAKFTPKSREDEEAEAEERAIEEVEKSLHDTEAKIQAMKRPVRRAKA